jgi:hypothetical protein
MLQVRVMYANKAWNLPKERVFVWFCCVFVVFCLII